MKLGDATVLLVDDEPDLQEIFSTWLLNEGCRVFTAGNGVEALKVLETEKVDALVSDIRMPLMDGVALLRAVYQRDLVIPSIIFVSGYGDVEAREMYGLGVEMLMEKPLKRKDLVGILETSLMEIEQNWLTPSTEPMAQSLAMEIVSLDEAIETCQFRLGKGGCCFVAGQPLTEQTTIRLSIRFAKEDLRLDAEGMVRWFDPETARTGISFNYLTPECRDWVIGMIGGELRRSFIPQCRASS